MIINLIFLKTFFYKCLTNINKSSIALLFVFSCFVKLNANEISGSNFDKVANYYRLSNKKKEKYLSLFSQKQIGSVKPFAVITLPKSGTYLIAKLLSMMTGMLGNDQLAEKKNTYHLIHFDYQEQKNYVLSNYNVLKIVNIRDPRGIAVSAAHWYAHEPNPAYKAGKYVPIKPELYKKWRQANLNKKISILLTNYNDYPFGYLKRNFKEAMELAFRNDIYINKFEDLVGAKGGGSDSLQKHTINEIAQLIGIDLNEEQVLFLAENLYGCSPTFRKGKAKVEKVFTNYHEELLHQNFECELKFFGYETPYSFF